MDQHRPSIPNPGNNRFPSFFPPPNPHHNLNHHHHHLPPFPRLPPPPPPHLPHQSPISLPPPPPPPNSFHHHPGHSSHQFVDHPPPHRGRQQQPPDPNFINHHRNHNHSLNNRPLDFQQAPRRVPERLVAVDRRRNRPFPTFRGHDPETGGPAVWNPPPRVPIDATPPITRRIPRACFDREHHPYRPTFQPVDRFRNDQDGGSRVRKDVNSEIWLRVDELPRERRDDFSRNDNRFQRDVDCNIHRKEFESSKVEHFSGSFTQKELIVQGRGDVVDGNLMWKNLPREARHSPIEVRNRAIDGGNGFSEKGKNRVLELERYGDRDRWDDRKKQKKNVLLKIQPAKPSFRNNYERSPSLCKDREPSQFPDHRLNKVRERSPIVSFKSNLLIVASSSGAGADEVSADRDDKNWNELGNKDDLILPSNVVEKVSLKTDSDNHRENVPCTLKKEEIHLEKNPEPPTNLKKLNPSPSHDPPVGNLEAPSHKTECFSEDKKASKSPNGKVLDKSYVDSGSGKECSPSFRKKRKITNPHTSLSSSHVLRKYLESMLFDEGLKDSGKDLTAAVKVTESTEIALTTPHMKSTAVGSTKAVDGKCADDSVSAVASVSRSKRRKLGKSSSGKLSGKPDEIQVDVIGPTQDVQRTSNSDGVIDKAQKGSSSYMVINDGRNMCLDVVSVPLQRGFAKGFSEAAPSEGFTNVRSASDSMNSSERQPNISRSGGADSALRSLGVSDIIKEASQNQSSAFLEEGEIEESGDANPSEKDNKRTQVSVPEEFHIREISDISRCNLAITLAADNVVPENSGQSINHSDASAVSDALNLPCTGRTSPYIEVGVGGGFPESETLEGDLSLFTFEGFLTKKDRKRKISELHRGTGKNNAYNVTLDNPCVNAYPSEVVTPTCNKKYTILAPEHGSAHGTPTEIFEKLAYSDVLPCDAEVPEHSIQVAPISSEEVGGLSVSEFGSKSDLAHQRKGLDLNSCNDASAQISTGLKLAEETCGKGGSHFVLSSTANMFGIPDEKQTSSMSEAVSLPQGDGTLLMTGAIDGYCGFGVESGSGRSIYERTAAGDCSSQNQCIDHEPLVRDMEGDINIPGKGDLSSQSEHLKLFTQSTSADRVRNSSPTMDNLSLVNLPQNLSAATSLEMLNVPNLNENPDGKLSSAQRRSSGKSTMEASFLSSISNSTPNHIMNFKMASATDGIANSSGKTMPFIRVSQSSKEVLQNSCNVRNKQTRIKNVLNLASSKALSSHSSFLPSSGRRLTTVIKSRTWHRTDNPASNQVPRQNSSIIFVPQQKQNVSQTVRAQSSSYVRKGNSLLRNPATAVSQAPKTSAPTTSVPQLNLAASDDSKNTPCEIPEKLSSPCNIDSSNCNFAPVGDSSCSLVADSSMATENWPQGCPQDMPKSSGNSDFEMSKSLEDQGSLNYSNQAASFTRRVVYIKHKSNQLVAASNSSSEISASNKDIPALMSDVYFKSKKNQLVRATSENSRQTSADPVDEGRRVFKSYVSRSANRRDPNRVSQKIPKSRKFSLVWKLCNTRSPKKGVNSLRCQQVLPHLLPWKRATYRRSLFRTSADLFKNSPLSHKFLSSRKTHIIYTRSGFSLRRSKVVSLAGSSLKWSISLEKRSKKVDKEANFAVAALEKEKGEKSSISVISSGIESKQNSLHEEHSRRRLRNDEYVRIGNGNQLIRNPKRRTRILANEKVRWSLHTARMRLAKKRKYCQFFTRFGKCNKGEGKCPYIHDPSKTAVCTKFLNGLCSNPKCKLTHKVIPERMPDCSFFLHGLCSNERCPYRHVSVNPKAAICESFLKGYCAEGNECRKKHSYMCPIYEATGECPEGSKCKLYHKKGKYNNKRKNTKHQKNVKGRYFGSRPAKGNNNEPETDCRKRVEPKDDGIILENGALADFISLDVSDDEEGEQEDEVSRESNQSCWEEQLSIVSDDDPDELIKPIRLLRIMSQAAEGTA